MEALMESGRAALAAAWAKLPAMAECFASPIRAAPPAQLGAALLLAYIAVMLVYRCAFEGRRRTAPPTPKGWPEHEREVQRVLSQFREYLASNSGKYVSINRSRGGHSDSNRTLGADYKARALKVDVSALDGVIDIDAGARLMHIEPGMPQDELARIALAHGFVPPLVLEFPGITAGGAVSGGGIESSSHKYGSFIDTVQELDIILGTGEYLRGVTRDGPHGGLFAAVSASYGTLGIITRLALRLHPAPAYVHVKYLHAASPADALHAMAAIADAPRGAAPDFIDGVALSRTSAVAVIGHGVDAPPPGVPRLSLRARRSDPWFFWHITDIARRTPGVAATAFTQALRAAADAALGRAPGAAPRAASPSPSPADALFSRLPLFAAEEYCTTEDFLFRFDRGSFWMARHGLQMFYGGAAFRPGQDDAAGPSLLLRLKYAWLCTTRQLYRILHAIGDDLLARTYVVQDFVMPSAEAAAALADTTSADPFAIWPLWLCPVRQMAPRHPSDAGFGFPVQATPQGGGLWFNVGVYGLPSAQPFDPVLLNKALEGRASELGGRKMLYAQSFYSPEEFWSLFDRAAYEAAREAVGATRVFPPVDAKLLMGPDRLAAAAGARPISLLSAWRPMFAWYGSLWAELLLPRALHPALGIRFTGMVDYAPLATGAQHKAAQPHDPHARIAPVVAAGAKPAAAAPAAAAAAAAAAPSRGAEDSSTDASSAAEGSSSEEERAPPRRPVRSGSAGRKAAAPAAKPAARSASRQRARK